ncbi:hypothetical protein GCM10028778_11500 [Barrientosiimonas marina]|uniref:Uncharacterized protein n=1 Tax=Lentibacillus kimchii TaxID=1542911 RepID=A0ABW2UYY0_9BACI
MAFGINRQELNKWKTAVSQDTVSFLTHYWIDERFPGCDTVTKAGCRDIDKLTAWGNQYGLRAEWIDMDDAYPHFDLFGDKQAFILRQEAQWDQIKRFKL